MRCPASIAVALLLALAPGLAWATAPMSRVRWLHTLTKLADGRVLAAGGSPGESATTAEIYDPAADTWTSTATPMLYAHVWHHAATLCDGRVLVAGQFDHKSLKAEVYDPIADAWSGTGNTKHSHIYGAVVPFPAPDCRVMLIGGYSGNFYGELYDPSKGVFADGGSVMKNERFFHAATRLLDGRVLVTGGGVDAGGTWYTWASVDLYDPVARTWTKAKNMKQARRGHSATLLPDGRVLVAGGTQGGVANGSDGGKQLATTEIYDPVANLWTPGPDLLTGRTLHSAVLLPSGGVLVLGGLDVTASATRRVEGYWEGSWHEAPPLEADRFLHAAVVLDDGGIFLTGGVHQATTEVYRTSALGSACDSGLLCGSGFCVGGLCCNEACDQGCRRCNLPGLEGTCSPLCADGSHVLVCADGTTTCAPEACVAASCAPFSCDGESASCRAQCTSVDQCAPGYACDEKGRCVAPPAITDGEASCAVEASPRAGDGVAWSLWGLAMAALAIRRRRRFDP